MPLMMEPGSKFRVELETDKKNPVLARPWFEFLHLSKSEWSKLVSDTGDQVLKNFGKLRERANQKPDENTAEQPGTIAVLDAIESVDLTDMILRAGLTDWGNIIDPDTKQPIPFDINKIDDILTRAEAEELLIKFREQEFTAEARKN
jgi:hypothetical protein